MTSYSLKNNDLKEAIFEESDDEKEAKRINKILNNRVRANLAYVSELLLDYDKKVLNELKDKLNNDNTINSNADLLNKSKINLNYIVNNIPSLRGKIKTAFKSLFTFGLGFGNDDGEKSVKSEFNINEDLASFAEEDDLISSEVRPTLEGIKKRQLKNEDIDDEIEKNLLGKGERLKEDLNKDKKERLKKVSQNYLDNRSDYLTEKTLTEEIDKIKESVGKYISNRSRELNRNENKISEKNINNLIEDITKKSDLNRKIEYFDGDGKQQIARTQLANNNKSLEAVLKNMKRGEKFENLSQKNKEKIKKSIIYKGDWNQIKNNGRKGEINKALEKQKELQKDSTKKRNNAIERRVTTELNAAYNLGRLKAYLDNGITHVKWNLEREHLARNVVCEFCFTRANGGYRANGIYRIREDIFTNEDVQIPVHPYCGCYYTPVKVKQNKNLEEGNGKVTQISGAGITIVETKSGELEQSQIADNFKPHDINGTNISNVAVGIGALYMLLSRREGFNDKTKRILNDATQPIGAIKGLKQMDQLYRVLEKSSSTDEALIKELQDFTPEDEQFVIGRETLPQLDKPVKLQRAENLLNKPENQEVVEESLQLDLIEVQAREGVNQQTTSPNIRTTDKKSEPVKSTDELKEENIKQEAVEDEKTSPIDRISTNEREILRADSDIDKGKIKDDINSEPIYEQIDSIQNDINQLNLSNYSNVEEYKNAILIAINNSDEEEAQKIINEALKIKNDIYNISSSAESRISNEVNSSLFNIKTKIVDRSIEEDEILTYQDINEFPEMKQIYGKVDGLIEQTKKLRELENELNKFEITKYTIQDKNFKENLEEEFNVSEINNVSNFVDDEIKNINNNVKSFKGTLEDFKSSYNDVLRSDPKDRGRLKKKFTDKRNRLKRKREGKRNRIFYDEKNNSNSKLDEEIKRLENLDNRLKSLEATGKETSTSKKLKKSVENKLEELKKIKKDFYKINIKYNNLDKLERTDNILSKNRKNGLLDMENFKLNLDENIKKAEEAFKENRKKDAKRYKRNAKDLIKKRENLRIEVESLIEYFEDQLNNTNKNSFASTIQKRIYGEKLKELKKVKDKFNTKDYQDNKLDYYDNNLTSFSLQVKMISDNMASFSKPMYKKIPKRYKTYNNNIRKKPPDRSFINNKMNKMEKKSKKNILQRLGKI